MDLKRDFAEYLYNRLPKIYRTFDRDHILERLIETFAEGGFNVVIHDTMTLPDLLDVDKCPKKFLPLLARSYGYEYSEELPELFQRRLLKNIVEMYKRKGTKSVVKFIARELSGFETEIIENKDFNEKEIELTRWDIRFEHYRNFILKLSAPYETSMLNAKEDAVKLVIKDFLPTNSNVFIITSYWFEEIDDFTNKRIEDVIHDTVREYNEETLKVLSFLESEVTSKMKMREENESFNLSNTPLGNQPLNPSYLNDPINSVLNSAFYTNNNNIYFIDIIKDFNEETHKRNITTDDSNKIKDTTTHNFDINGIDQTNKYDILLLEQQEKYYFVETPMKEQDNAPSYLNGTSSLLTTGFFTNIHYNELIKTTDEAEVKGSENYDYDQTNKMFSREDNLAYKDIQVEEDRPSILKESFQEREDINYIFSDNSLLNRTSCLLGTFVTNGILSYDIIKTQGQEDQIFIL